MGKVASNSVAAAIRAGGFLCHDIHSLDRAGLKRTARDWLARDRLPPRHVCEAMAHRNGLFSRPDECLWISLVRDPIERNLAAFFETIRHAPEEVRTEEDPDRLIAHFAASYPMDLPLDWFEREFRGQIGIDVLARPFDPSARWMRDGNLILLRTDCPDDEKGRILTEALGRPVRVGRLNDSAGKAYRPRYEAVRARARFPAALTGRIYGSRFARHFWTEAERAGMAARWTAV